jgi:hypothetical protein
VLPEFSARAVSMQVIEHLERRRPGIAGHPAAVTAEVKSALGSVRRAYVDSDLPRSYIDALETELVETLPARWDAIADPYTKLENTKFALWRGGDVVARLTYVFVGLVLGGLVVEAPFIPIYEKWFPFLLSVLAWWLPDAQVRWQKRRYAKELGQIVAALDRAQPALDQRVTLAELLPPHEERPPHEESK